MSSLVVNTNIAAIDAYNNLNATDSEMSKSISQLSSGLQIQSAADNPAGYVVSRETGGRGDQKGFWRLRRRR